MKIVVTAGGIIWNESHPALKKYGNDVITVRRTPDAEADLIARVGMDRNVLVLTDNDPRSFLPFQTLAKQFQSRRIHLFVCLPFSYESRRRKQEIFQLLGDVSMIRTLCLVDLDTFLKGSEKDETLGGLQLRIRNGLIGLIDRAAAAMEGLDEFTRYRFDFSTGTYQEDDFRTLGEELRAKLLSERKSTARADEAEEAATGRTEEMIPASAPETGAAEETAGEPGYGQGERPEDLSGKPEEVRAADPEEDTEQETADPQEGKVSEEKTGAQTRKTGEKKRRSLFAFLRRRKD